jgi:hypothetical protein
MSTRDADAKAVEGISRTKFALRLLWVAVRILLCVYAGHRGAEFFYQGF